MSYEIPKYSEGFFSKEELALSSSFLEKGYAIVPADDQAALDAVRDAFVGFAADFLKVSKPKDPADFLNNIHKQVSITQLNEFRLSVYNQFNGLPWARKNYFSLARRHLEVLIGNELAMQKRINLSIQLPNDSSSLLPVHSDVWSGDSPFEMVLWVPLVDCFKTKGMFFLPPKKNEEYVAKLAEIGKKSAEDLYETIAPDLLWLDVPYGHVLIFSHIMMHGNRINTEPETRWSMNCRFKGLFAPFWDKRLGEFFEPITIRPASRLGMEYSLPGGFNE